jgi:hypothetical protein
MVCSWRILHNLCNRSGRCVCWCKSPWRRICCSSRHRCEGTSDTPNTFPHIRTRQRSSRERYSALRSTWAGRALCNACIGIYNPQNSVPPLSSGTNSRFDPQVSGLASSEGMGGKCRNEASRGRNERKVERKTKPKWLNYDGERGLSSLSKVR